MDWKQQLNDLFDDRSKDYLVHYLSQKPNEIKSLLPIIEDKDEKPAWRAAWIIDHLNQTKPDLIKPNLLTLLNMLKKTNYNGVRRSLLKIMVTNPSSVNEDGELIDLCFQWIYSPAVPIAVRAYAMQYIFDLLKTYPELKNEFQIALEPALMDQSKGVSGKARKMLKAIKEY